MNNIPYSIILPTEYGNMIVNRNDINQTNTLLKTKRAVDHEKISFAIKVCENSPNNSIALDIGANFGTYSLALAKTLGNKNGKVYSFEAQRIIYYMLCGSVSLNSIENCMVLNTCVGNSNEAIDIPNFDYSQQLNFGSIEFGTSHQSEQLSQQRRQAVEKISQIKIDDLHLSNLVYAKVDVEGMELDVLNGAIETIRTNLPIFQIEILKSSVTTITNFMSHFGYKFYQWDGDLICIPPHLINVYNFDQI